MPTAAWGGVRGGGGGGEGVGLCLSHLNRVVTTSKSRAPVVTRTHAVRDSPVSHGALRILLQALHEHGDRVLVVVVEHVAKAEDEELAGFLGGAGDLLCEGIVGGDAEVVISGGERIHFFFLAVGPRGGGGVRRGMKNNKCR